MYNTLPELFLAIANEIRIKLGTEEPIAAEDFSDKISEIPGQSDLWQWNALNES